MTPEDDVRHQLGLIGLRRPTSTTSSSAHFDFDHCGGNRFFPGATFVVQREQYEYARATPERCFAQDWDLPHSTTASWTATASCCPGSTS